MAVRDSTNLRTNSIELRQNRPNIPPPQIDLQHSPSPRLINSKLKKLFVKKLFYLTHNPASRRVISSPEEFDHPLAPTKSYSNTGLPERPRVFIVYVAVCDCLQGRNRDAEIVGKQATYKMEQDTGRI